MSDLIFEEGLGNKSSQKIIFLLTIWELLSIDDIQSKTGISKSQVHLCLKNLLNKGLLIRKSKGIYCLSDDVFMKSLRNAYEIKINQIINKNIREIQINLKERNIKRAEMLFNTLVSQYDPILDKNFGLIISSLVHEFYDEILE